jgi:hypothetical protein
MKIKNVKYFLAVLSLGLFSCDSYLDINDNPNQIPVEKITPNLQLPGAMVAAHRVQAVTMNVLGNIWMQNWGGDVNNFTGVNIEEYNLQLNNNFYNGIWDGIYPAVANFEAIINFNSPDYDNHKAVAYILKSYYMQYVVDMYGDAPYSQAFKGQENPTPTYDDDKVIYRDLITNIDKAIALFNGANSTDVAMGASDVIFQGSVSNWIRFANTLKLKILLRHTRLTDAETTTYLTEQFATIQNGPFLTANAVINPGYNRTVAASMNPFYSIFFNTAGNGTQTYNSTRATKYISDFLNGESPLTSGPALIDPRRGALYTLVNNGSGNKVAGATQGLTSWPEDNLSQIGPGLFRDIIAGMAGGNESSLVISLAETKFLIAEAIERSFIPGNAKSEFDAGISASMTYLGAAPGTYLTAINGRPSLGWNAGTNIESIMTQKWLALNSINGLESFIDYTRTGFPNIPLATTAQFPNRPRRLLYPTSELVANSANVPSVSLNQIFVQGPFWYNN